jgi:hypothetical protein
MSVKQFGMEKCKIPAIWNFHMGTIRENANECKEQGRFSM